MKKSLLIGLFTLSTISFFSSGCVEPRYYRTYHHHSDRYYRHHHRDRDDRRDYDDHDRD